MNFLKPAYYRFSVHIQLLDFKFVIVNPVCGIVLAFAEVAVVSGTAFLIIQKIYRFERVLWSGKVKYKQTAGVENIMAAIEHRQDLIFRVQVVHTIEDAEDSIKCFVDINIYEIHRMKIDIQIPGLCFFPCNINHFG